MSMFEFTTRRSGGFAFAQACELGQNPAVTCTRRQWRGAVWVRRGARVRDRVWQRGYKIDSSEAACPCPNSFFLTPASQRSKRSTCALLGAGADARGCATFSLISAPTFVTHTRGGASTKVQKSPTLHACACACACSFYEYCIHPPSEFYSFTVLSHFSSTVLATDCPWPRTLPLRTV